MIAAPPLEPAAKRDERMGRQRLRILVRGAVQGVGFRPHTHRLAASLALDGFVENSTAGVSIEVEGDRERLGTFLVRLCEERPPHCLIESAEPTWLDAAGLRGFEIRSSAATGARLAFVSPDLATCPECFRELLEPGNRRFRYPFINCTHCGPRFSIIEALPYDRANTTMRAFAMCPACEREYHDPADRRFHAQPNACPDCGPQLALWDPAGRELARCDEALIAAAAAIRAGRIVAMKGLGGFHLVVDATNDAAIGRLRRLKHRDEKPFAVMFPAVDAVAAHCVLNAMEERLLASAEAPIVLLPRRSGSSLAGSVAPRNANIGALLPYTPLHHLLMRELPGPVVATSGNLTDEPICVCESEALQRLNGIADVFLVHNRPVARHVDDSVVRVMAGREIVLRRARGYAPLPVPVPSLSENILATGAHLKNSVALGIGGHAFVSQHIGDLETEPATRAFENAAADLPRLYEAAPARIAADAHPDYASTRFARTLGLPVTPVQHHYAHVLACMAENELRPPVLGVAWDGTGYGLDGTTWGSEFLSLTENGFSRLACLRPFRLPGGDAAAREPRRAALGLLFDVFGPAAFDQADLAPVQSCSATELATLKLMLERRVNAPLTSSAGRLFDGVASLLGLRQQCGFEAQAAVELEQAAAPLAAPAAYEFNLSENTAPAPGAAAWHLDWRPMLRSIVGDLRRGVAASEIAAQFHQTLAAMIVRVALLSGQERIALGGGCFQSRVLLEGVVRALERAALKPYWPQRVPPNDGGIALGQLMAAAIEITSQNDVKIT